MQPDGTKRAKTAAADKKLIEDLVSTATEGEKEKQLIMLETLRPLTLCPKVSRFCGFLLGCFLGFWFSTHGFVSSKYSWRAFRLRTLILSLKMI